MPGILQAVIALIPLLLTPVVVYVLAEGWLDLGGGEKDVLLALPWLIWSLVFATSGIILIFRRRDTGRWIMRSAILATGVLVFLWIVLFAGSFLGIAGR